MIRLPYGRWYRIVSYRIWKTIPKNLSSSEIEWRIAPIVSEFLTKDLLLYVPLRFVGEVDMGYQETNRDVFFQILS